MPTLIDLKSRRGECEQHLLATVQHQPAMQLGHVTNYLSSTQMTPDEVKNLIDVAAKGALSQLLLQSSSTLAVKKQQLETLIDVLCRLVSSGHCAPISVCNLVTELFDQSPMAASQQLFAIVEERVALWKSETYFETCKNALLRTCNDLLRRSSKSLDTVFCGRVQLFLARLFPLDEKSALNLMGQFNLENVTHYRTEPWDVGSAKEEPIVIDQQDDSMLVEVEKPSVKIESSADESSTPQLKVDFELYSKFWSLQETFRNPNALLTSRDKFAAFTLTSRYITSIFKTYPLDEHDANHHQQQSDVASELMMDLSTNQQQQESVFFSKYLTNEKLLDLQLSDCNFRRCILLQFLITLQYLITPAKVKGQMALNGDQEKLVREMMSTCFELLKKTPPRGEHFAQSVERILASEQAWNKWKNDSCPSFVKQPPANQQPLSQSHGLSELAKQRKRKPALGDQVAASMAHGKTLRLGSKSLTKLFEGSTNQQDGNAIDNLPSCRVAAAQPDLKTFFVEAIEQLNDSELEDSQKLLRKSEWQWRALRLLTSAGPHFFTSAGGGGGGGGGDSKQQQQRKLAMTIPDFLDMQMRSMAPSLGLRMAEPATKSAAQKAAPTKSSAEATPQHQQEDSNQATAATAAAATPAAALMGQDEQDGTLDEAPPSNENAANNNNNNNNDSSVAGGCALVKDHKTSIALLVSAHWTSLAKHLKFEQDEIDYFETQDVDDKSKQAQRMLELWEERESNYGRNPVPLAQFEAELRRIGQAAGAPNPFESIADRLNQLPGVK